MYTRIIITHDLILEFERACNSENYTITVNLTVQSDMAVVINKNLCTFFFKNKPSGCLQDLENVENLENLEIKVGDPENLEISVLEKTISDSEHKKQESHFSMWTSFNFEILSGLRRIVSK